MSAGNCSMMSGESDTMCVSLGVWRKERSFAVRVRGRLPKGDVNGEFSRRAGRGKINKK